MNIEKNENHQSELVMKQILTLIQFIVIIALMAIPTTCLPADQKFRAVEMTYTVRDSEAGNLEFNKMLTSEEAGQYRIIANIGFFNGELCRFIITTKQS